MEDEAMGKLLKSFEWKEPNSQTIERLASVREGFKTLAMLIVKHAAPGWRRRVAFETMETASMWAAKAITHE